MSTAEGASTDPRPGRLPLGQRPEAPSGMDGALAHNGIGHATALGEPRRHHVDTKRLADRGLLVTLDDRQPASGEFRRVKRPLLKKCRAATDDAHRCANVILLTSGLPGAGKTFCAVNLAASLSLERDLKVLLVDADVGKPHISRELGLAKARGLIDVLADGVDAGDVLLRTDLNDLQVLPAGRPHEHPTEVLASEGMSRLMLELATRYADRIVVMDSPPLLITNEAQVLASHAGQVVLVVETGRTTQQQLAESLAVLDPESSVSIILNKSRSWRAAGDYGGDYAYWGYERR